MGHSGPFRSGRPSGEFNITDQNLFKSDGCFITLTTDVNGDGLTDLFRYSAPTNLSGNACAVSGPILVYVSNGDGSFTLNAYSGPLLERLTSKRRDDCLVARQPNGFCAEPADHEGWTRGANFFLLDVDGDGKLDLVTTELPNYGINAPVVDPCTAVVCTRVYKGTGNGTFDPIATNLANKSIYVAPSAIANFGQAWNIVDVDGDGLADITGLPTTQYFTKLGVMRSRGDGNFDGQGLGTACTTPIDFNGDGRNDCLHAGLNAPASNMLSVADGSGTLPKVADFNLVNAGQELQASNAGFVIADINADGRQDIIRWKDDPAQNAAYLSNGDGTFAASPLFGFTTTQLKKSDGTADFVIGDFTGRGSSEILRLRAAPTAGRGDVEPALRQGERSTAGPAHQHHFADRADHAADLHQPGESSGDRWPAPLRIGPRHGIRSHRFEGRHHAPAACRGDHDRPEPPRLDAGLDAVCIRGPEGGFQRARTAGLSRDPPPERRTQRRQPHGHHEVPAGPSVRGRRGSVRDAIRRSAQS